MRALEAVVAGGRPGQELLAERLAAMRAAHFVDRRLGNFVGHSLSTVAAASIPRPGDAGRRRTCLPLSEDSTRRHRRLRHPGRTVPAARIGRSGKNPKWVMTAVILGDLERWRTQGEGRRRAAHPPPARVTRRSGPDRTPAADEERRCKQRRNRARRDEIPHGGTVLSRSNDSPGPGLTRVYKGA